MEYRQTLEKLPPTFTRATAVASGIAERTLYRWRDAGVIFEISRGVFRNAQAPETAYLDVLAACARAPRAVVCLVSALAIHDLTDEVPHAVQLAIPRGVNTPRIDYPPTEISRFKTRSFELGREQFEVSEGEFVPVYTAARSIVDVMRIRHRIGDTIAYSALHAYLARPGASAGELSRYAAQLGGATALRHALQVVLSR